MKLTYLHQYFNTPAMAGGSRTYQMAKRLAAQGHDVHVITSCRTGDRFKGWKVEQTDGFFVHWIFIPYSNDMPYLRRILAFLTFSIYSTYRTIKVRGDLIFATSTPLTIAIPAIIAKKITRAPMVFEVRDLWPDLPIAMGALTSPITIWLARLLEKTAYKQAVYVIGCSPGMCEGVIRQGIDKDKVIEIPNSCDIDSFNVASGQGQLFREEHLWLGERPLVVYAGTYGRINGVEYLVRLAHATLPIAPEIAFLAVGHGVDEEKIKQLSIELDVHNRNFFMLPKQPKSKIPDIYSAASVITSLFLPIKEMWANSANKFFDGMAAGKPVAINYGGWQASILAEHKNGLVLESDSVHKAAERLSMAIRDPKKLQDMGRQSLVIAKNLYSRDEMAIRLENVLNMAKNAQKK